MKTATRHSHVSENHHGSNHRGSSDHSLSGDISALRQGFAQLREDVTELMQTAAGVGQARLGAVRETAAGTVDGIKEHLSDLSDSAAQSGKVIRKQVVAHPLASALIGLGGVLVIARFLTRK